MPSDVGAQQPDELGWDGDGAGLVGGAVLEAAFLAGGAVVDTAPAGAPSRAWELSGSEKAAIQTPKEKRSMRERLSALRHAVHALANSSAHGDEVADSIKWDREKALAVIAAVSGLAACKF